MSSGVSAGVYITPVLCTVTQEFSHTLYGKLISNKALVMCGWNTTMKHLLHIFCITTFFAFAFAAGLDKNSNGSLNTASACSSIDESSDDTVLQPVKEQ